MEGVLETGVRYRFYPALNSTRFNLQETSLSEWQFAHADKTEKFALVHQFCLTKVQGDREIEFRISVKEFVTPPDPAMKFYAEADKQTNQKTLPYTPSGWGSTLLKALSECMGAIRRFPYEGE